jgi:hypothetical protein
MVHELLGLNNNRVSLKDAPNVPRDLDAQEVVLSSTQDRFFAHNRYGARILLECAHYVRKPLSIARKTYV